MANLDQFENDLRDRRTLRGWSQEQLARRSGLSRAGISAIETDRLIPSAAAALALAAALECRVEDLFRLRGSESRRILLGLVASPRAMPILEGRGGWAYQVIPRGNDRDGLGPSRRCLSKRVVPRRRRMRPRAYAGHGLVRSCGRIIGGLARPRRRHSTDRFTACQPHGTVVDRWRAGACRGRASHNGRAARGKRDDRSPRVGCRVSLAPCRPLGGRDCLRIWPAASVHPRGSANQSAVGRPGRRVRSAAMPR